MRNKLQIAIIFVSGFTQLSFAGDDLDQLQNLSQSEFKSLSQDIGATLGYKAMGPAETLGITGFDIGVAVTATDYDNSDLWKRASSSNDSPSTLFVPKLHVLKGLPLNFDVGAYYTSVPSTDVKAWGAELRYAIIEGGMATPAVAVRASYSRLEGINQLDLDIKGIDVSISKGFTVLTGYAGAGYQRVESDPQKVAGQVLSDESIDQARFFAGGLFTFALMNFVVEYDNTDSISSFTAKAGLRF